MATHSVFLPGNSQEQRNLVGYSPCGRRVRHSLATKQQHLKRYVNIVLFFSKIGSFTFFSCSLPCH